MSKHTKREAESPFMIARQITFCFSKTKVEGFGCPSCNICCCFVLVKSTLSDIETSLADRMPYSFNLPQETFINKPT
jgi:hypothetical protein